MAVSLVTGPTSRPITLDEVKRHLRIETSDDDLYLESLIDAGIAHLESVSGLKLITQTWRQYLDELPEQNTVRLAVYPVRSLTSVVYFDANGDEQEVPNTQLELDRFSNPARLEISSNFPVASAFNGIEIVIEAGFGDTATDVPDSLVRALLILIAHNYEFRGAVPIGDIPASEPHGFRTLIAPFRRMKI